jgi:hypothetical protein
MRRLFTLFATLAACSLAALSQSGLSDDELLTALDDARFFSTEVNQVDVQIVSITPDETREATIRLQFADREDGTYTRIEFLSPDPLAGQIYLSTPDATYFLGPDQDFPIKRSASTELFGDAAVAQTSGIRFADNYEVTGRRDIVGDDDGVTRLELDLEAIDSSVAFREIVVTVDLEALRPISMTLYALSRLPLYDVFFEAYELRNDTDDLYVRTQRIVNRLLTGRETTSDIVDLRIELLPDELFDPDALGPG